jgi:F-type H+-transporting ATPase subunit a
MSHVAFPYVLALFSFFIFHYVGVKKQGLGKYLKGIAFMPGVPKAVYILLTPIEIATFFLVRPLTLSLRLFANMFAGHLLLLVFITGGDYMLHDSHLFMKILSPFSFAMGIGMSFFELMVQCLQAYIITLLTALFIAGALADEH